MSKNIYNMKSQQLWYNPDTSEVYTKRVHKTDIKFDSKSEYDLYIQLKTICDAFDIAIYKDCKITLEDDLTWIVDFKLVFPLSMIDKVSRILSTLNGIKVVSDLPVIYIEYKGVLTDSSTDKLDKLFKSNMNHKVIMLSYKSMSYMQENTKGLSFFIKPIFSIKFFMLLLNRILFS